MSHYEAERTLPYRQGDLFDLVADVEKYPDYVPFWAAARIVKQEGNTYWTRQILRFRVIRHEFQSKTVLMPPDRIEVESHGGPFKRFDLTWRFAEDSSAGVTHVALALDFFLKSKQLGGLVSAVAGQMTEGVIGAFERRAVQVLTRHPASAGAESGVAGP